MTLVAAERRTAVPHSVLYQRSEQIPSSIMYLASQYIQYTAFSRLIIINRFQTVHSFFQGQLRHGLPHQPIFGSRLRLSKRIDTP